MNVALVANLRTDAGGQYNQQRRNNVAAANHVIDLFQRNNRRRVRGLMNRVVGMVALMEPTFSIEALIEVLFDRLRPLWIPAGYNVIWNGPRNFRDDDVLDTQVEFAMRVCNLTIDDMMEWQGLRVRQALVARGHIVRRL